MRRRNLQLAFIALGWTLVVSACGGGGGGGGSPQPTPNPIPAVAGLSPSSATAGAAPQTLIINGTNLLSASTVTYNGAGHTATFVSATELTIQLTASDQATAGTYPVVVTNPTPGGGASNAVNFTVTAGSGPSAAAPTIATQPQNVTVNAGNSATFTVSASGTAPLSYQWTLGGTNISGATSASYTIVASTVQQTGGNYAVVVSNAVGSVTSANATLAVNTSSAATTVTAVSSIISSTTPTIVLSNIATMDFTGQSELMGQTASVAQVVDSNLNALASDRQIDLDVDLSDPNTIQIAVPMPPTGTVTATIHAASAITNATAGQVVTVYVYSSAGDSGDGEDTFSSVPSTVDTNANTITVSIPGGYFQPAGTATYIADLKIGLATAFTSPAPAPAIQKMMRNAKEDASHATPNTGLSIPCPVGAVTCIERSRFNPVRYLSGVMRPHYGVDFVASIGTDIYVPSGGTPSHAFTQTQYAAATAGLTCPSATCATVNGRAGMSLTINYGGYKLKFLHLSSIDSSILNADGSLNKSATTSSANPVAQTGNTGAAMLSGPHLHFEFLTATTQVCTNGTSNCTYVHGRADPFPFIASQLNLQEASNQTVLAAGAAYGFNLTATDSAGISVSSNVQNAEENGGNPPVFGPQTAGFVYDPTRKICLASSSANVLQFPTPDENTTFAGIAFAGSSSPSYCAPWGTTVAATGLANSPATTVTVEYSADATVPVLSDPLSSNSASLNLGSTVAPASFDLLAQVSVTGTGSGSTSPIPVGTSCGAGCYSYASGAAVQVTETPAAGSTFTGWSGACSGTGACNVTMNSNQSVTATFTLTPQTVDAVTPSTLSLGSVGGCAGGTLTGIINVTAAPGEGWTPTIANFGLATVFLNSAGGVGSEAVTVTVAASPQKPTSGYTCTDTISDNDSASVTFYFSDGQMATTTVTYTYLFVQ